MLALTSLGMENGSRDAGSVAGAPDQSCWASGLDMARSPRAGPRGRSVDTGEHSPGYLMDRPIGALGDVTFLPQAAAQVKQLPRQIHSDRRARRHIALC